MTQLNDRPLVSSSVLIGLGMGGFFDGILFHQILQIHNMLSNKVPKIDLVNMEINMFWDGIFHAFTWTMTLIGLGLLWRVMKRPEVAKETRTFIGSILLGWGLFNLVEGVIDHHILQLHHVVEVMGLSVFDYLFLLSGVVLIGTGWTQIRSVRNRMREAGAKLRAA